MLRSGEHPAGWVVRVRGGCGMRVTGSENDFVIAALAVDSDTTLFVECFAASGRLR